MEELRGGKGSNWVAGKPPEQGATARTAAAFSSERAPSSTSPGPGWDGDELGWSEESSPDGGAAGTPRTDEHSEGRGSIGGEREKRKMSHKTFLFLNLYFKKNNE